MTTGKRGRPRKNDKEKRGVRSLSAPLESLEIVEDASCSVTAASKFGLYFAEELIKAGEPPIEFKRGKTDDEELRQLAKFYAQIRLLKNKEYAAEVQAKEEVEAIELSIKTEEFTNRLIQYCTKHSKRLKFRAYEILKNLRKMISEDPTGRASYDSLTYFMTHDDSGRDLDKNEIPRRTEAEITVFITQMMTDPIQTISSGEGILSTVE